MKFPEAVALIDSATDAAVFFGPKPDDTFRSFAKIVHPDHHNADPRQKERASHAFTKLNEMYQALNGKSKPVQIPRCGDWFVTKPLMSGDVADIYMVEGLPKAMGAVLDVPVDAVLKIAQSPAENDLMKREAASLKRLWQPGANHHVSTYTCQLYAHFEASGRVVNVVAPAEGCVPLSQIRDQIGPIPWRHVIWMVSRALEILGHAHGQGIIHGAITPDHLLYRPEDHGLKLVDWTASVQAPSDTEFIPYRSPAWKELYPPEIDKKDAHNCTDIYMLVKSLVGLAETPPRRFRAWIDWCLAKSPLSRPSDAWDLKGRWQSLAEEEYGAPKFVPLVLPPTH